MVTLCYFVALVNQNFSLNTHNKLTDPGSSRSAAPVSCEVKLLILSLEFGWFEENNVFLVIYIVSVSRHNKLP